MTEVVTDWGLGSYLYSNASLDDSFRWHRAGE